METRRNRLRSEELALFPPTRFYRECRPHLGNRSEPRIAMTAFRPLAPISKQCIVACQTSIPEPKLADLNLVEE